MAKIIKLDEKEESQECLAVCDECGGTAFSIILSDPTGCDISGFVCLNSKCETIWDLNKWI